MNSFNIKTLVIAVSFAFSAGAMAENMSKVDYQASKDKIAAEYKSAKTACGTLSGNANDICEAEAKGHDKVAAAELEALIPVGRRTEILALLPVGAELVIGGALLGVLEHLVGFARILELRLGTRFLVDVGVEGARELAVGALDLLACGVAWDAEH